VTAIAEALLQEGTLDWERMKPLFDTAYGGRLGPQWSRYYNARRKALAESGGNDSGNAAGGRARPEQERDARA